jgi:hypothetical protein
MKTADDILTAARARAVSGQLPYAGAVTPQEAYELLQSAPHAKLIDVRTNAERDWVGKVNVPEDKQCAVQWNLYPGASPNPEFSTQLAQEAGKRTFCFSSAAQAYVPATQPSWPPSRDTRTPSIFWKALKATRTPKATGRRWADGARPACHGQAPDLTGAMAGAAAVADTGCRLPVLRWRIT